MDYLWPSAAAAEEAILSHLGNSVVEKVAIRLISVGDLAAGLPAHAPAVVEIIETGNAVAVHRTGRVLCHDATASRASWKSVRKLWEDPASERERLIFAQVPLQQDAAEKIIQKRIATQMVARVTHFVARPGSSFRHQLAAMGWFRRLGGAITLHTLGYAAGLASWALIARAALSGRWDLGWFWGWVILLAIGIPLELVASWWQGWLSFALGGLLKQRLLAGSLEIDVDKIRHQGHGQVLSRVLESGFLETLSLTGGAATVLSAVELLVAAVILALGAAPGFLLIGFVVYLALIGVVSRHYVRLRKVWTTQRNALTHTLIEKMNGQRTRIAQQPPELWHVSEDRDLIEYLKISESVDRFQALLTSIGPRGWLTLGMAMIGYVLLSGSASAQAMAISTAGVVLGYQSLRRFVFGISQLAGAWHAWELVRDLFAAASDKATIPPNSLPSQDRVLDANSLVFSYPGRETAVLKNCSLSISRGDSVLLQGASGSGKSTFGAILAGLRRPTSGLVLANGFDLSTLGALGWRRRVATAPQYHDNHILAAPLSFNLLMGKTWPASPEDFKEAWDVCHELGLGPLLGRMPAGLSEMVGDSGWQLSQGEKSRVFLARAILQGASLMILDESFAALDPETLELCLKCVLRRAPSLLVIAHP